MNTVATLRASDAHPAEPLASWYMPGMIDGFGDRLLMIDNAASDALELLRFRGPLVATPGFEEALHERVRQLRAVTHPAFSTVRGVERLERDASVVLVSTSTPGQRLSEFMDERRFGKGLHAAFVIWIVRQALEPIAVLHAEGEDVAHSALTAGRIILAPDGHVRIVEYVLGSALRHLDCSAVRLWREFGILAPCDKDGRPLLDRGGDVFQLGVLALSMLLARRITRGDVDERLPLLLDQWGASARSQLFGEALRQWLERALQIGENSYQSASEAHAGLSELPLVSASRAFEFLQAGSGQETPKTNREIGEAREKNALSDLPDLPVNLPDLPLNSPAAPRSRVLRAAIGIALVAAIAEGVVIARLMIRQPPQVAPSGAPAPAPAPASSLVYEVPRGRVIAEDVSLTPRPAVDATAVAIAEAARNQRLGGVRLSTPIELQVLRDDRVLGSSADGVIVTSAGTHVLEFINTAFGFRISRAVTFRAGEITTVTIPVPAGRLNANAVPWAEVWIDGRSVGQTPLGNMEIPVGEHELVFRHPDLGERRQRVVVRADVALRVSTTFDR